MWTQQQIQKVLQEQLTSWKHWCSSSSLSEDVWHTHPPSGITSLHSPAFLLITHNLRTPPNRKLLGELNSSPVTWGDLPLPPDCLGRVSSTPWNSWLVSWLSLVMSAFSWRPNTSGWAVMGRFLRYST